MCWSDDKRLIGHEFKTRQEYSLALLQTFALSYTWEITAPMLYDDASTASFSF